MVSRVCLVLAAAFSLTGCLNAQSYGSNGGCPMAMIPSNIRVTAKPSAYFANGSPSFLGDLLEAIKGKTGIPYTVTSRPDLNYGNQNADGSFEGSIIGEAVNNHADLVGADLTISSVREAAVDFLVPFAQYHLQLLVNSQYGLGNGVQYLSQDNADLAYLKASKNATLLAIAANIESGRPGSIVADDAAGAAKVLTGNFAYVAESMFPARAVQAHNGKLAIAGGYLGDLYLALAVQQGSPLREKLNIAMLQLEEDGVIQNLLNKYNVQTS